MRYTLNQILRDVEAFADSHGQVGQYLFKDPIELLNDHESRFPVIDVVVRPAPISRGTGPRTIQFNLEFFFADLVEKDLSNEQEVLSDQAQIAMDLLAYFDKPEFDDKFTLGLNNNLNPFYEKGDNEMTGWSMLVTFNVLDLRDACAIPTV
jgi:hypothetical protein